MSNSYDLGNLIRVTATFTDYDSGDAVDPSDVNLSVYDGRGTVTTYTYGDSDIARSGTGVYYFDVNANSSGTWSYRWWSTGSGQAAVESRFEVRKAVAV